jgi:hypothetical protein
VRDNCDAQTDGQGRIIDIVRMQPAASGGSLMITTEAMVAELMP